MLQRLYIFISLCRKFPPEYSYEWNETPCHFVGIFVCLDILLSLSVNDIIFHYVMISC